MQKNAKLNMEILTTSNITFSTQCILELIANSLAANATAIAIRIHAEKHEIHVIDNGIGISKNMLEHIAEYDAKISGNHQHIYELIELNNRLINIRRLSDSLTVASRHRYSVETFMKVFNRDSSNVTKVEQRPSSGTTISVYGFREIPLTQKWDIFTFCFFIAAVAVVKLEVSFSIRDEERKKIVLRIAKPHSPIEILKRLFGQDLSLNHLWLIQCNPEYNVNHHGYIGLSDKNSTQWIFLNHEPIYCPFILKLIKIGFEERVKSFLDEESHVRHLHKKNMFILLFLTFSQNEFKYVIENGKRYVVFYDMQNLLDSIKNCVFKCLAEETVVHAITPYLCKTQLLKQIYLKSRKSDFNRDIDENNIPLMKKRKIIMIDLKKTKITTTIRINQCNNKRHNERNSIKIDHYMENSNNSTLNSIRCQASNRFAKHTNFDENEIINTIHNDIFKSQTSLENFDITNDIESDKIYNYHNDNNNFINMTSPLSEWSNWTYYTINKKCNTMRNAHGRSLKNETHFLQFFQYNNRFNFLPRKLHDLLQHRHIKLTNVKRFNTSPNSTILFKENWQDEQIPVRPCNLKRKLCELRLSRASLKCIKIINQFNDEFIVARMMYDEMKILLMIDQHAIHERIRYETLLLKYKVQNEDELLSINLRDPLAMEFPTEIRDLILRNEMLLKKFGINLGSLKKNTLLIRTVPQCLITNNDHCNGNKILSKIHNLLKDILKNRKATNHTLPLTIHNAIASEACHGAIKFGDKLSLKQCTSLMKLLRYTKFPNRCAHGRPTIIPVMELSELEKRAVRKPEVSYYNFNITKIDLQARSRSTYS